MDSSPQDINGTHSEMSDEKVSISQAYLLFHDAGIPRSRRQIRRYCKDGDLECVKVDTEHGRKYLIDRNSLGAWLVKLQQTVAATNQGHDPDASGSIRNLPEPSGSDHQEALEAERTGMVEFLKSQIIEKDKQINALLERDHETNILIQGLQGLLLGAPPPRKERDDRDTSGSDQTPNELTEDATATSNGGGDNSAMETQGYGVK